MLHCKQLFNIKTRKRRLRYKVKYKFRTLEQLERNGIVAVIRAKSNEQALKIVDFAYQGGIKAIEITMTVPGAIV